MHQHDGVPTRSVAAAPRQMERRSAEARNSYHHAGLRQTLVDASLALLAERGPCAVTLREVARRAGVSHTAPYRHFANRSSLLAAAAAKCHAELGARLSSARRAAGATAAAQLEAVMRAYVDFAMSNPGRFRLMFGPEIQRHPAELQAPGNRAIFEQISRAIFGESQPTPSDPDPQLWVQLAWATMHGVASIAVDVMTLDARSASISELLRTAARMIHSSLAPKGHEKAPTG